MRERKSKDITYEINENGCYICTSHKAKIKGYTTICIRYKNIRLHRYMYEQKFGEIKKDNILRHICDNPACINPDHLIEGTNSDNSRDMRERGRSARGIKHHSSKLTEQEVLEIFNSTTNNRELAEKYEVAEGTIGFIKKGRTWKHLTQQSI
jgi:hypothetical protein